MVLFAEGTTADGNFLLPFKSSLFGAADIALAEGGADVYPRLGPTSGWDTEVVGNQRRRTPRIVASTGCDFD